MEIKFDQELRSLNFAKEKYLNETIALLEYKDEKMIELNKSRVIGNIELMIKTMEELKAKIN